MTFSPVPPPERSEDERAALLASLVRRDDNKQSFSLRSSISGSHRQLPPPLPFLAVGSSQQQQQHHRQSSQSSCHSHSQRHGRSRNGSYDSIYSSASGNNSLRNVFASDISSDLPHAEELYGSTRSIVNFWQDNAAAEFSDAEGGDDLQDSVRSNWTASILQQHVVPAQEGGFFKTMKSGSLQQSVVVSCALALVNGVACYLYYVALNWTLDAVWHRLPQYLEISERCAWMWIPGVVVLGAILVGLAVSRLGEPGDMSFTVACVHSNQAYIPIQHVNEPSSSFLYVIR